MAKKRTTKAKKPASKPGYHARAVKEARVYREKLAGTYELDDPNDGLLLDLVERNAVLYLESHYRVDTEGSLISGRFNQLVVHPALRTLKASHQMLLASLKALHLDVEIPGARQ